MTVQLSKEMCLLVIIKRGKDKKSAALQMEVAIAALYITMHITFSGLVGERPLELRLWI